MTFTEWKKKRREKAVSDTDTAKSTVNRSTDRNQTMRFTQWKEKRQREKNTAQNTVQGWAQESGKLIQKTKKNTVAWFDKTQYETHSGALSNMITQADNWRSRYAEDDQMLESIDSVVNALKETKEHVTGSYDYYSLWDSAEAYNMAEQNYQWEQNYQGKTHDELTSILAEMEEGEEKNWLSAYTSLIMTQEDYDSEIAKLQEQIKQMEAFYDKAYTVESWYTDYGTSAKQTRTDSETDAANLEIYNELVNKYGTLAELDARIQQEKLTIKRMERAKEYSKFFSVMNPYSENYDPEFEEKSRYISTNTLAESLGYYAVPAVDFYGKSNGSQQNGYADINYEYINGNEDVLLTFTDEDRNLEHMTQEDVALYNYYYATAGKETADRYLDLLQETLNNRGAQVRYEDYRGNTAKEILLGFEAGWDQFESGMKNFFNFKDDYIPMSETQILAGEVRKDLEDSSAPMWYNLNTGRWEDKVFGNSAGQLAFDAVNTAANMLPSVLTSTAVNLVAPGAGTAVGAAMTGASSAGNAYQEMLRLGYDQGQARAYSTLVGSAEAGLSYALSGIRMLGGEVTDHFVQNSIANVDNAFFRVALKLGGNMLSEGIEESLTEVLVPMLNNMTLNTNEKVDWGEVAYSGLMGALTANLFEGPSVIAENTGHYKAGKALDLDGISPGQLSALGKISADEAMRQLAERIDENTGAYTLGRLFNETGAVLTHSHKAQIAVALEAQGVRTQDARVMIEAFATVMEGGSFTPEQIQMLEANDVLAQTVVEVLGLDPSGEDGITAPANATATDPSLSLRTSPKSGVALADAGVETVGTNGVAADGAVATNTETPTTQQVLQYAIENMSKKPMDPKSYNALNSYKNQLRHMNTTEALLDQKREVLQQQQAAGADPSLIQQTQADIAKLEKMLAQQKNKLQTAGQNPALQKVMEQSQKQMQIEEAQAVENSRKNVLDNSAESDTISTDGTNEESADYRKKVETIAKNRKNGAGFAKKVFPTYDAMWDGAKEEITILTSEGKVRVDAIGRVKNENGDYIIRIAEFKSSEMAPLTTNQKKAFPAIVESGGVVVGKGKEGFWGGTIIPPGTIIEVVRGTEGGSWYVSDRYE